MDKKTRKSLVENYLNFIRSDKYNPNVTVKDLEIKGLNEEILRRIKML